MQAQVLASDEHEGQTSHRYTERWIAAGIIVAGLIATVGFVIPALAFLISLAAAAAFRKRLVIAAALVSIGLWSLSFGYFTGRILGILE